MSVDLFSVNEQLGLFTCFSLAYYSFEIQMHFSLYRYIETTLVRKGLDSRKYSHLKRCH